MSLYIYILAAVIIICLIVFFYLIRTFNDEVESVPKNDTKRDVCVHTGEQIVDLSVGAGIKFGFGFGIGLMLLFIVLGIFIVLFFGVTLNALFQSLA